MVGIFSLWLPILLAGVAVFLTSSVVHMVLPHHRKDFRKLPDEDGVMEALRRFDLPPGDFLTPCSEGDMGAMKDPAFRAKAEAGPLIVMTVLPNGALTQGMGKTMGVWFLFCVLVSFFTAYAAELALAPGAHYMAVFRFAGTVAFGFYALGQWPRSIWYRASWATTLKSTADAFLFGLVTAGVFGWLWPA
jgi:hypothetical protein